VPETECETAPTIDGLDPTYLANFIARTHEVDPGSVHLAVRPLRGGLESKYVAHVVGRFGDRVKRPRMASFVVKRLEGGARREADLYSTLFGPAATLAPRMLGTEVVSPTTTYLYLEYIHATRVWPWRHVPTAGSVLTRLGGLHAGAGYPSASQVLAMWDYEAELLQRARWTLALFEHAICQSGFADLRRYRPSLRRMVERLPAVRSALLSAPQFGSCVVHGDVHSRNVVLRSRAGGEEPVFVDWGRARIGSPLEDVSSWLQSLGCWEYEVRRRHDTLLRTYLAGRGMEPELVRAVRDVYWLAAACNTLSGALEYQLTVALDGEGRSVKQRASAVTLARRHLRVIRRADVVWRA
jgi:phosphotransferase family enzyme